MKTKQETTQATQVAQTETTLIKTVTVQNSARQLHERGQGQPREWRAYSAQFWGALSASVGLLLSAASSDAAAVAGISVQPQSQVVAAGVGVTLSVTATGEGPFTYEWWNEFGPLYPPQTGAALSLSSVRTSDAGRYSVRVRNAGGTVSSAEANLTVTSTTMDNVLQARSAGGTGADPGANLDADASGNTVAVGSFSGTATFGSVSLNSAGANDIFVVKYAPDGSVAWARRAGGSGDDAGAAVSIDRMGNVHVTGSFAGTADFGSVTLKTEGSRDAFVASYDRDGNVLWARSFGSVSGHGSRIATDAAGNSYVAGEFAGNVVTRGGTLASAGAEDVFLAKYGASGFPLWSRRFGGEGSERATGLALSGKGEAVLTGNFTGPADFDGTSLNSDGSPAVFVLKCDRTGALQWARATAGLNTTVGVSVVVDDQGNAFLSGAFSGTATFGTVTVTARQSVDCFIAKYNGAGVVEWAARNGAESRLGLDDTSARAVDGLGSGALDWSGGDGARADLLVGQFPGPAVATWARQAGTSSAPFSFGMLTDSSGNRFLTGFLENPDATANLEGDSLALIALAKPVGPLPPLITTAPQSLTVNPGASATFSVAANGANLGYQWRFKGAELPGAVSASLTVPGAQTTDAGGYSVVVFSPDGSVTSPDAVLTVNNVLPPPPGSPVAVITSPAEGFRTTNSSLMVFGTASGSAAIVRVEVQTGSGAIANASGSASWFTFVSLRPGANSFRARAVDASGNTGEWTTREFVQGTDSGNPPPVLTSPLIVAVSGNGRVTPNLNGQILNVGSNYTLTAVPDAGSVFAGWSGGASSSSATLTFAMQANMSLRANFNVVSNALPPLPQTSPLTLVLSGNGRVTPNLNGQSLTIGSTYTMNAVADAGSVFAGWSGSASSSSPTLTFTMQANFSLRASFLASSNVVSPPPIATNVLILTKASYNGLFYQSDAIRHSNAGPFTLAVSVGGAYSGSIRPGNKSVSLSGKFSPAGNATNRVTVNGTPLVVTLLLATVDGQDQVIGSVQSPTWQAPLWAARAATGSSSSPVPYAGRYTVALPGAPDAASSPGGHGFGTLTVDAAGKASLTATLGDGTAITRAVPISTGGAWPFYASLYSDKGMAAGWITFADRATDDLAGDVRWESPAMMTKKRYAAGFTNTTSFVGSRYVKPASNVRVLNFDYGVADFAGGNVAAFQNQIYLAETNKVLNMSPNKLSITLTLSSGTFSGSATDPGTGKSVSFKGAVLQKRAEGAGQFLGTDQTGKVDFGK